MAARPTWAPAKGGNEQGGTRMFGSSRKCCSRDLAAHTTLKLRSEEVWIKPVDIFVDKHFDDSDDEDDDGEDDTEALFAELERIKKERAEEKLRKERQQEEAEAKAEEAELMRGNPLIDINNSASFNAKRRGDDDVVFKNQARGETKAPKRFINDTIRNGFHRKFLQKYMK